MTGLIRNRIGSLRHAVTIVGLAVTIMLLAGCGSEVTPTLSTALEVTDRIVVKEEEVSHGPLGVPSEQLEKFVKGANADVVPETRIVTNGLGIAELTLTIREEGRTAATRCRIDPETIVDTLPNGAGDNLLLELVSGTVHCDHDELERFSRGTRLSVLGMGQLSFQGTSVRLEFDPGEGMSIGLADGLVSFEFDEGVVEGEQSPVVDEGLELFVDLGSKTQSIEPALFTPEDNQIFEDLGAGDPPPTQTPFDTPTPTPMPTSSPTPSPTATAIPLPTTTQTPTPDPTPTDVPLPTPTTALATVAPTSTPTPVPTVTPAPTATLAPTATPVPTVTPVPTPTPMPTATLAPTATPPPTATPAAVPLPPANNNVLPHAFVGVVTIDGVSAPNGTVVTAWIQGFSEPVGEGVVSAGYSILVSQYGNVSFQGKIITFKVGAYDALETAVWRSGGGDEINLTASR